jgi:AcrR family transcriptional regulator
MSKSGVFAHFGSREELQIMVLFEAHEARFISDVLRPALAQPRGLERLRAIFEAWVARTVRAAAHGCIFTSGAAEYDDLLQGQFVMCWSAWCSAGNVSWFGLCRRRSRSHQPGIQATDPEQAAFQLHAMILTLHHDERLLRSSGSAERALSGL